MRRSPEPSVSGWRCQAVGHVPPGLSAAAHVRARSFGAVSSSRSLMSGVSRAARGRSPPLLHSAAPIVRRGVASPGGFKRPHALATAPDAAAEETGVIAPSTWPSSAPMIQGATREPMSSRWSYLAVTPEVGEIHADTEPGGSPLADRRGRVRPRGVRSPSDPFRRLDRAADQLEQTDLATAFVGETFALSELQNVYEERGTPRSIPPTSAAA